MDSNTDNSNNNTKLENTVDDIIANNDSVLRQKNIDSVLKNSSAPVAEDSRQASSIQSNNNGLDVKNNVDPSSAQLETEVDTRIDEYVKAAKSSHSLGADEATTASPLDTSPGTKSKEPKFDSKNSDSEKSNLKAVNKKKIDPFLDDTDEDGPVSAHGMYGRRSPVAENNKFKKADQKLDNSKMDKSIFGEDYTGEKSDAIGIKSQDATISTDQTDQPKKFGMFSKDKKDKKKNPKNKHEHNKIHDYDNLEIKTNDSGLSDELIFDDSEDNVLKKGGFLGLKDKPQVDTKTEQVVNENWSNDKVDLEGSKKSGGLLGSWFLKKDRKKDLGISQSRVDGFGSKPMARKPDPVIRSKRIKLDSPKHSAKKRDWVLYTAIALIVLTVVSWAGAMYSSLNIRINNKRLFKYCENLDFSFDA